MNGPTPAELIRLMRECGGIDESVVSDVDILDASFDTLGCDSITLLEVIGRVQRAHGVKLGDDVLTAAGTPGELLGLVDRALAGAA